MSFTRRGRLGGWMLAFAGAMLLTVAGATAASGEPNQLSKIDQQVRAEVSAKGSATFFVYLREQADVSGAAQITGKAERRTHVHRQLTATADRTQAGLRQMLSARGQSFDSYWIANALRVTGNQALLNAIAKRAEVWKIEPDRVHHLITPVETAARDRGSVNAVEWGVNNIRAPQVWSDFGVRGEGVVVEERHRSLQAAMDGALRRVQRAVRQRVQRRREPQVK